MTDTITLPRSVVEQALSTLEGWSNYDKWVWHESALSTAKQNTAEIVPTLRAALEQPQVEQEPVAWIEHEWSGSGLRHLHFERPAPTVRDEVVRPVWTPLYTHPQPKPEPLNTDKWPEYPAPSVRPVYATSANTKAVRDGFEVGGYEKTPPLFTKSQLDAYALNVLRAHGIGGEA